MAYIGNFVGSRAGSYIGRTPGLSSDGSGNLIINDDLTIGSESISTSSTTETTLISFSASLYRTLECTVQITKGTSYHSTKLMVIHDGSDTYMTEYATLVTGSTLGSFSSSITNSGNILIQVTPSDATARTIKIKYNMISA